MQLVVDGAHRAEIARRLGLSLSSVDKKLAALKAELGHSNRVGLALACARLLEEKSVLGATQHTGGMIMLSPAYLMADLRPEVAPAAIRLSELVDCSDFPALFDRMAALLARFGVRGLTVSHLEQSRTGQLVHKASRSNIHGHVPYDVSLPVEANPTFRHAFESWDPLPIDLEALIASPAFEQMPPIAQAQTLEHIRAGFVRGIVFPIPALFPRDRLVVSLVFDGIKGDDFPYFTQHYGPHLAASVMAFRNAHVELAKSSRLAEGQVISVLLDLADDLTIEDSAKRNGLSVRSVQRLLSDLRHKHRVKSNIALVHKVLRSQELGSLPF